MTALTAEALRLPPRERLKLIQDVWNSLDGESSTLPTTDEELAELDRRRAHYAANPDSLVDWEALKAQLKKSGADAH
jgi:putative addiction module component (TIGR02574 family)